MFTTTEVAIASKIVWVRIPFKAVISSVYPTFYLIKLAYLLKVEVICIDGNSYMLFHINFYKLQTIILQIHFLWEKDPQNWSSNFYGSTLFNNFQF